MYQTIAGAFSIGNDVDNSVEGESKNTETEITEKAPLDSEVDTASTRVTAAVGLALKKSLCK